MSEWDFYSSKEKNSGREIIEPKYHSRKMNRVKCILHASLYSCAYYTTRSWPFTVLEGKHWSGLDLEALLVHFLSSESLQLHACYLGSLSFPLEFSSFFLSYPTRCTFFPPFIMPCVQRFCNQHPLNRLCIVRSPQKTVHRGILFWKWSRLKTFLGSSDGFLQSACLFQGTKNGLFYDKRRPK